MGEGRRNVNKENRPRATKTSHPVLPKTEMEQAEMSSCPKATTELRGSNGKLGRRLSISKKRSD
eukprot:12892130-Prorocentrum_lima.AAC.1